MTKEQMVQQVHSAVWPHDDRTQVDKVSIGILYRSHYYLITMGGKAVFEIGDEYDRALELALAKIMSQLPPPSFSSIEKEQDPDKRKEMLREALNEAKKPVGVPRKKSRKNPKPKPAPAAVKKPEKVAEEAAKKAAETKVAAAKAAERAGGGEHQGWEQQRRRRAPPRRTQDRAVSSVVVYTPVPAAELKAEISGWSSRMGEIVDSIRQKPDHMILMATPENDAELRELVGWLREWGLQAKEYKMAGRDPGQGPAPAGRAPGQGLASAAERGLQDQVSKAILCRAYLEGGECGYGIRCKFRCYPR